ESLRRQRGGRGRGADGRRRGGGRVEGRADVRRVSSPAHVRSGGGPHAHLPTDRGAGGRAGQPCGEGGRQADQVVDDRGDAGRLDVPVGRGGDPPLRRGVPPARYRAVPWITGGDRATVSFRAGPRHLAVQLPGQPGRPQDRAF